MNGIGKALLLSTGVGLIGYGAYKLAQNNKNREWTSAEKKCQEFMNRQLLINPLFNPIGAGWHLIHPNSKAGDSPFDSPIVKYMIDRTSDKLAENSEVYHKLPANWTPEQRMEYFKQRGGTGFRMDTAA